MFNLYEIVEGEIPALHVVDVGAADMGVGTDAYSALLGLPNLQVVGFEPNVAACAARQAGAAANRRYFPYAIGDGRSHRFYECENPLHSSLYEPNKELFLRFHHPGVHVVRTSTLDTVRLDDVAGLSDCDFLKLDIQGGELDALNGAAELLRKTVVVHTEVEFLPAYKGQPLFGDIDRKLVEAGFLFHNFAGVIYGCAMRPLPPDAVTPHQLMWAEGAIYVRNFMDFDRMSPVKLLNVASILHFVYGSFDLAALALQSADRQTGGSWRARYAERLQRAAASAASPARI